MRERDRVGASGEKGKDASVTIEPVARDLAVGKKSDQRKFAQAFAYQRRLHPGLAKQRGAAGDAADIDTSLRRSIEPAGKLAHHAGHVTARALGVATAEKDRVSRRNFRAQHEPASTGVDRQQI